MFNFIKSLFSTACYAAADDKKVNPARVDLSGSAYMVQDGLVGSSVMFKNVMGVLQFPYNDSVSAAKRVTCAFGRTSPVDDADYAGMPIGSTFYQLEVTSTVVTGVKMWIKTGSATWTQFAGNGNEMCSDVTLTSAQVKALKATPIALVAAPGADLAIVPTAINIVVNYGGTNAFTEDSDDLSIGYATGAEIKEIESTGLVGETNDEWRYITFEHAESFIPEENKAVVITNLDAEIAGNAGADNTIQVRLYYRVVPTDSYS